VSTSKVSRQGLNILRRNNGARLRLVSWCEHASEYLATDERRGFSAAPIDWRDLDIPAPASDIRDALAPPSDCRPIDGRELRFDPERGPSVWRLMLAMKAMLSRRNNKEEDGVNSSSREVVYPPSASRGVETPTVKCTVNNRGRRNLGWWITRSHTHLSL